MVGNILAISYDDLSQHDLLLELDHVDEITCVISYPQALVLKNSWDKYERYMLAKKEHRSSFTVLFCAVSWWLTTISADIKHRHIQKLNDVYILGGSRILPVKFAKQDNSDIQGTKGDTH